MIYFITDGEYVKIGFTDSDDVGERMKTLQVGNARRLSLIGTMPGGREEECLLHALLSDFRASGEWFDLNRRTEAPTETLPVGESVFRLRIKKHIMKKVWQPGMKPTELARLAGVSKGYASKYISNGAMSHYQNGVTK